MISVIVIILNPVAHRIFPQDIFFPAYIPYFVYYNWLSANSQGKNYKKSEAKAPVKGPRFRLRPTLISHIMHPKHIRIFFPNDISEVFDSLNLCFTVGHSPISTFPRNTGNPSAGLKEIKTSIVGSDNPIIGHCSYLANCLWGFF
jgi:hypothetical protein